MVNRAKNDSPEFARHANDGSGHHRPRLEFGRNREIVGLKICSISLTPAAIDRKEKPDVHN
jgi:hypothetical protein